MSADTEPENIEKQEGEKPAEADPSEEKAKPEEPPEKTEGKEGDEEEEKPEPKPEEKHKRQGGWQRKIDRLERENEVLREIAARSPKPAEPKEKTAEEKGAEYLDELVEKRIAAREAKREQQAQLAELERRTQEVRAKHPDWDEAVSTLDIPVESLVGQAILTSERGPEIMYLLATDDTALARLRALPAAAAAVEIGRLEAKLASSTAAPPTQKPLLRKSPAPAPITPVTPRGPTTVKAVKDMTFDEYDAWRNGQTKR